MTEQELERRIEQIRRDLETVKARRDDASRQIAELMHREAVARAELNRTRREAVRA